MRILFCCLFCFAISIDARAQEATTSSASGATVAAEPSAIDDESSRREHQLQSPEKQPSEPPRDPTVPSSKILERLQIEGADQVLPSAAPVMLSAPLPKFIVKAIVLADRDHGVAMLECNGRKLIVRLSRDNLVSPKEAISSSARLKGFAVEGLTVYVADFSDRSILLRTADQTVLVQ